MESDVVVSDASVDEEKVSRLFGGNNDLNAPLLSECRDVVLVCHGINYRLKVLEELYPNICWRYQSSELYLMHEFREAQLANDTTWTRARLKKPKLTTFYAYINSNLSPYEFYCQPKFLDHYRAKLEADMQDLYSEDTYSLEHLELYEGAPCACLHAISGVWQRAQVVSVASKDVLSSDVDVHVMVRFVDWGDREFIKSQQVKPLFARFAKWPPMALKCRMHGVSLNDLEMAKLGQFEKLIESVANLVRVEILAPNSNSPSSCLLVNLFHPTLAGCNLGAAFHSKRDAYLLLASTPKDRKEEAERERKEIFGDSQSDYSSEEEESETEKFVFRFEKFGKPFRARQKFEVSYVEHARMIFVKTRHHLEKTREIQKGLNAVLPELEDEFPARCLLEGVACAAFVALENFWCRAVILRVENAEIRLFSIDFGFEFSLFRENLAKFLKPLPSTFKMPPQIWPGRLDGLCDELPWYTETLVIRRILSENGGEIEAEFLRQSFSHGAPYRMNLYVKAGEKWLNLADLVAENVEKSHQKRSWEIVPYKNVDFLKHFQGKNGEICQKSDCRLAHFLLKGKLELTNF